MEEGMKQETYHCAPLAAHLAVIRSFVGAALGNGLVWGLTGYRLTQGEGFGVWGLSALAVTALLAVWVLRTAYVWTKVAVPKWTCGVADGTFWQETGERGSCVERCTASGVTGVVEEAPVLGVWLPLRRLLLYTASGKVVRTIWLTPEDAEALARDVFRESFVVD